jgi:hypothetical protein
VGDDDATGAAVSEAGDVGPLMGVCEAGGCAAEQAVATTATTRSEKNDPRTRSGYFPSTAGMIKR